MNHRGTETPRSEKGAHVAIATFVAAISLAVTPSRTIAAEAAPSPQALEQFERDVRPVLVKHCYECHGPKKEHNGLRLDSRAAVLKGGDSGPAVMPGKPEESLLIGAVKHESFEMPPEPATKLSVKEIAALETWVRNGAPWPAEQNAVGAPQTIAERAQKFWGFKPVRRAEPPAVANSAWSQNPVDRFLAARWEGAKLEPAADADPRALIRRVTFVLTGLPPTAEDVEAFVAACTPSAAAADKAYVALVDRLLASPRFGEHWARHWMDWVRYCDSHGSEGDPAIPEAWQYRDYLIRALNADVPYDQLVREHLAGDLLPQPRRNEALGINESIVGTAHLRFVEHGYQPVDPLEDLVKVTDNQIEVAMKSFQALTVTCARCHDHKFDAISQADFYALYPAFAAARPTQVQIDLPERLHRHDGRLLEIKRELKGRLAEAWLAAVEELPQRLRALPGVTKDEKDKANGSSAPSSGLSGHLLPQGGEGVTQYVQEAVDLTARRFEQPLFAWLQVRERSDKAAAETLAKLKQRYVDEAQRRAELQKTNLARRIVVDEAEFSQWRGTGAGVPKSTSDAGAWTVSVDEKRVVESVLPAGAYTHLLSTKHGTVLTSPTFKIEHDAVSVRIMGGGYGTARLIIENYAVPRGGIYNLSSVPLEPGRQWYTWDTTFWRGFEARIELVTNDDLTIVSRALPKDAPPHAGDGRSHIGISEIWLHHKKTPTAAEMEPRIAGAFVLDGFTAKSADDLARRYQTLTRDAIAAWRDDRLSDDQAALLDGLVRAGVLPNDPAELPEKIAELAAEYRRLEAEIPIARRAPGVMETAGWDQPLLIRGDHKRPGDPVPRRYLEGLGSQSLVESTSDLSTAEPAAEGARLRLAELIASPENPLTARVAVNRLWHYVFGRGIVATVDNFGELGRKPTHPELLDFLAARFVDEGWSIKRAVRELVLTRAFRLSSTPSAAARKHDPENLLLSHASLRRLDAEAIRDSLVAVAGRLQQEPDQGPGYVHGEPPRLQTRRSVFVLVKRNSLPLFLETFDQPKPFTTIGARDVTNVPGQALTMLNDILVIELAQYWAKAQIERPTSDARERIRRMYVEAFAREPDDDELAAAQAFVADLLKTHQVNEKDALSNVRVWQDFAHALFNMKEFMYVR